MPDYNILLAIKSDIYAKKSYSDGIIVIIIRKIIVMIFFTHYLVDLFFLKG